MRKTVLGLPISGRVRRESTTRKRQNESICRLRRRQMGEHNRIMLCRFQLLQAAGLQLRSEGRLQRKDALAAHTCSHGVQSDVTELHHPVGAQVL